MDAESAALVELVQQRRNAIHAFRNRPIGDHGELVGAVRSYLTVRRTVNARLPYPDDSYVSGET